MLSLTKVDAHRELFHTMNLVKYTADEKEIQLETKFEATDFHIEADISRLAQIFWNVLKNAIKFSPRFGKICVRTCNKNQHEIQIEIQDNGIGSFLYCKVLIFFRNC